MTTLSSNSRRPRTKCNESASPNSSRECDKCRYALYETTRRCTNYECSRHARESGGAMTAAQLLHEYAPPPLFHGRHWGEWTLDAERLCLVYDGKPVDRGDGSGITEGVERYLAFVGKYEIDIEHVSSSAAMLDWIYQINKKAWANARVVKDLLSAFQDIFDPQANLCSASLGGGTGKSIKDPQAFLQHRIATVGKDRPVGEAA
jgi:hypothetical protein